MRTKGNVMKQRNGLLVILLVAFLVSGSCSSEPAYDKKKFTKIESAAHAVQTSVKSGSYSQVADKVQKLSAEIAALKGSVATAKEKQLLQAYTTLLSIYDDGLVLWKSELDFAFFADQLKGSIYVNQDVDPLVEKYHFATESHLYKPTGQYWKSISGDSMGIIWKHADSQMKTIDNIANY